MIAHQSARRLAAEALGTALLLATVVGSGIMGERLAQGNLAIALLANAIATGCMLFVLIAIFGAVSGAHFNPLVTIIERIRGKLDTREAALFIGVQIIAAIAGVWAAHAMFGLPLNSLSQHARTGASQWFSEFVATFGLILVILQGGKVRSLNVPALVALYITAAYWFTASTSFANPAVTLARSFTGTFSGIRGEDVLAFVISQTLGAAMAFVICRWFGEDR